MKVISTNIGKTQLISWRGKDVKTGIYKYPVEKPVYLDLEDLRNDHVVDRRYHGGLDKACYLYDADRYPYWKELYPELDWNYGMFGENLTIMGLDERIITIGSTYRLGTAIIQITQPRQPCYKLGIRFGAQKVLKQFIAAGYPGIYIRVLNPGEVQVGDHLILEDEKDGITIAEMYQLFYNPIADLPLVRRALEDPFIIENNKESLLDRYKDLL